MTLPQRILALHAALEKARLPHAFGGALALAYCTLDPRGTTDIDVNVFVPAEEARRVLDALPEGVRRPRGTAAKIAREGQVRLWWDETPIDLFLNYAPIHTEAAMHSRMVPFEGEQIPVLGPTELTVFKVMFDRTRDWADVEEIAAAGKLDAAEVKGALGEMLDPDDERFARLSALSGSS